MLHRLFVSLFLLGSLLATGAQAASPPRLLQTIGGEQPIRLKSLQINAEISGGLAETTVRMVFFNPNRRQLEGQLQFPLLDGQSISAFALDIDDELRPAVPVEKAKGRQVFEEVERRQVDPAILEATQGSNFKLRVYPIAAMGTRTVELKYVEALTRHGGRWSYRLPLAYGETLQDFELTVKANGIKTPPQANNALGVIRFASDGNGYQARVARSRFTPTGILSLKLPVAREPKAFVEEHDGDTYFFAEIPVPGMRASRILPNVVGLLWDSSSSGTGRDHEAELLELDRYFKAFNSGEVRLVRLRDRPEPVETFTVVNGDWRSLRDTLEATIYDGASALSAWLPQVDVGEYLLFSDGLSNYGDAAFPELGRQQRLYALNSSLASDSGWLAAVAERSGGRLIAIDPHRPGDAARMLLTEGAYVAGLDAEGATALQVESRYPERGLIRVAGRLLQPSARLKVFIVQRGKQHEVNVLLSAAAARHSLAARMWATYRLRTLDADREAQRGEIRRIGQRFGIPTRETSLIVLDRVEDYVRYDIEPPHVLRPSFEVLKARFGAQLAQRRDKQIDRVVRDFNAKIAWWEKTYPKDEIPKPKPQEAATHAAAEMEARSRAQRSSEARPTGMAAPPPAAAAPAPAATLAAAAPAASDAPQVSIRLQKWIPDAPYISRMRESAPEQLYAVYLDEKPSFSNSTAFFLDAADILMEKGQRDLALRVLSNLAEMQVENRAVLRILGYRLLQAGAPALAIPVFREVRKLAEEEPQSFRDLGLAYAMTGQHQRAIDHLYEVVVRPWDGRFAEIELVALAELNAIIAAAPTQVDTSRIDARLLKNMPLDLRTVLTWDADNSDMDLWVTDPNGEKCYYGRPLTYQGGRMSRDFIGGYGPEEFSLREAKPGIYKVEVNFYGSRQQIVASATTLQLKLTTGFGTSYAKDQMVTLRIADKSKTVFVGEFQIGSK